MQNLSALDAISPAISRTRRILFSPFQKGRTWKLAATGYLATASTMFLPFPLFYLALIPAARRAGGTLAVGAVIAVILLITTIFLIAFYLCSRIQFAFFDIVLNQSEFVAPAWRKYGRQSRQWMTFKLILGTVVATLCALPVLAYARHVISVLGSIRPGQPPPPDFMIALFAGYSLIILLFGSLFLISSLLSDFMVPLLVVKGTGLAGAFRSLVRSVRKEPGQFAGYALGKLLLGLAGYMGASLAFQIVFILALLLIGGIVGGVGFLFHLAGVPKDILLFFGILIAVVVYLFFMVYVLLLCFGTVLTFLQSYTLYFLGGRYPQIGEVLERTDPHPARYVVIATPPPPPPLAPQSSGPEPA